MEKNCIHLTSCLFNGAGMKTLFIAVLILFSISGLRAQVTIGSLTEPESGVLLELKEHNANNDNETSKKGMIFSRVKLSDKYELYPMYQGDATYSGSNKDKMKKNHTGMIVFNVAKTGDFVEGLYLWNGAEWKKIEDLTAIQPTITDLIDATAVLQPATYSSTRDYEGVLKITYIGGNGGAYNGSSQPVNATNGLKMELLGGKLNYGGGEILYRVYGRPAASSPTATEFTIDFLGVNKKVALGTGNVTSVNVCNLSTLGTIVAPLNPDDVVNNDWLGSRLNFDKKIIIPENGGYAVALRLYASASPGEYYIYLVSPNPATPGKNDILDSAELDLVPVTPAGVAKLNEVGIVTCTIMLGSYVEEGRELQLWMQRINNDNTRKITLRPGTSSEPNRTSLIWWKL